MATNQVKETKEVTEIKEIVVAETTICDVCGKVIRDSRDKYSGAPFWSLATHHNDWGNDSYESLENFDLCSVECLTKKFEEYCKESSRTSYNTLHFEVGHEYPSPLWRKER